MATLYTENGNMVLRITAPDGSRPKIRLGRCDQRTAEGVRLHVDRLVEAKQLDQPIYAETAKWLASISDTLHQRISRAGLCAPRRTAGGSGGTPLAKMIDRYIEKRKIDMKPWSIKMFNQCRNKLVGYFGADRAIDSFTTADALDFKRAMSVDVSKAYTAKLMIMSKHFFKQAVDAKLLETSPFAGLKSGSQKNKERQRFITGEVIERVVAEEKDWQRGLVYALARFAGLRIPSELGELKWTDINFDTGQMLIHSPKTEHHAGKETRKTPISPQLRPILLAARKKAAGDAVYVVPKFRNSAKNLRTQFHRILTRLEIPVWPRLFQNLRSSCQTEWCEQYPVWAVCEWLGNSEEIAKDHYLQVRDHHFAAAAGLSAGSENPKTGAQSGPEGARTEQHRAAPLFSASFVKSIDTTTNENRLAEASLCESKSMGEEGFEPSKA